MMLTRVHLLDMKSYALYIKGFFKAFRLDKFNNLQLPKQKNYLSMSQRKKREIIINLYLIVYIHCLYHSKFRHREKGFFFYSGSLLCQDSAESPHLILYHK